MTLTNLREQFNLKVCGEPTSGISTTVIDAYLNQGYQKFLILALDAMGDWQINGNYADRNLVAGQIDYAFENSMLKIEAVYIKPTSDSEYIKAEKIDIATIPVDHVSYHPSNPQYDFIDGNMFVYLPNTIVAVTSGIKIFYIEEYSNLVNTGDSPKIPVAFQPFLWIYAAREYCQNHEKWNKFKTLDGDLLSLKADIENFYLSRAKPLIVRPAEEFDY